MRNAAIILVLALGACAPSLNLEPRTGDPCYRQKTEELERIAESTARHGFGAGVFHRTTHYSEGYASETWWGFENMWYVTFQSHNFSCTVSYGSL